MTRLHLVRHGPTHARTMVGWTDLPADLGDAAAIARLSDHLPRAPVVSSDLIRAVATADAILGGRPRLPPDAALREIHFGTWENRSHDDIAAEDPTRIRAYWETPGTVAPPEGESWDRAVARISPAIDGYLAEAGSDLIVVCHFGVILTQLQRALGVPTTDVFAHRIEPLSVTTIATDPVGGWTVEGVNHLP